MRNMIRWTLVVAGLVIAMTSCKRDSQTNWTDGVLAPLATTNLTINNLVTDSFLHTNPDSSLSIVYQNTVYSLNLADQYIHIPDTSIGQKYNLDSLGLPNVSFYDKISLGAMAINLENSGNFLGNYLIAQNGHNDSISTISGISLSPFYFSATSYFQTATLSNALVALNVDNRLPLALQNVSYEMRDSGTNTLILSGTFPYIAPNASAYNYYTLQGVTITSSIAVRITSFTIPGTGGATVLIDTSNYIAIGAYISKLSVDSAIAAFPSENIISQDQELTQKISNGRLFTFVDCNSGQLQVTIRNAVPQPLQLTYKLLGAYDRFGNPLTAISTVPAAQNGQLGTINRTYDLTGYSINLTGSNGALFNTYTQLIIAHIDSTGQLADINQDDSLFINYNLQNISPNYIKGYMGQDTITYAGTSPFSFANLFSSSAPNALKFKNASISISVENSIGVDGTIQINNLTSVNANGTEVPLMEHSINSIIGRPQYIARATDFPLTPSVQTFNLSSANSNINDFISNLPNQIKYNVLIKTNPHGNNGTYNEFAYLTSGLNVNLNLNIPLSILANNLILRDSFNFSPGYTPSQVSNIQNGTLHVIVNNKFPLQANITLLAYDSAWNLLDTLLSGAQVSAAPVNANCRATQSVQSILNVPAPSSVINKISTAKHAVMTVVFNTKSSNATCNGQYLKIYSDYNIDATITADFNYKVKF